MQNISKLTKAQLIEKCVEIGIKTKSTIKKDELINLLSETLKSLRMNSDQTYTASEPKIEFIEKNQSGQETPTINQPLEPAFSIDRYLKALGIKINIILARTQKKDLTYDILDTSQDKNRKLIVLEEKQRQMKIGEIWQEAIGSYDGFTNLGTGHDTGLDIKSDPKKIIIELKNRTNTDNSSSRKANLDKLAKFKKENPDYDCIYANINANSEFETMNTGTRTEIHNGQEIKHMVGMNFLQFIFNDNTDTVINFIKQKKQAYYSEQQLHSL